MLKSWRLGNFKAIRDPIDIELSGVTVLSGLNSSGKSSVLQSIRLVSQTLASPVYDSPLILNGYGVQLGTFDIIHNDRAPSHQFEIGFRLRASTWRGLSYPPSSVARSRTYSSSSVGNLDMLVKSSFARPHGKDQLEFEPASVQLVSTKLCVNLDSSYRPSVTSRSISSTQGEEMVREVHSSVIPMSPKEQKTFSQDVAPEYKRFLPQPDAQWYKIDSSGGETLFGVEHHELVRMIHFLPGPVIKRFSLNQRARDELDRYLRSVLRAPSDVHDRDYIPRSRLERTGTLAELIKQSPPRNAVDAVHETIRKVGQRRRFSGGSIRDLILWAAKAASDAEQKGKSRTLRDELNVLLSNQLAEVIGINQSKERYGLEFGRGDVLVDVVDDATSEITNYFVRNVRYLGPLRAEPRRAQGFSPTSEPDDVGPRGEYAAAVYEANKRRTVKWRTPDSWVESTGTLDTALNFWLAHLGVASQVSTRDTGETGVVWEVTPRPDSSVRPLTSVGVGVSQILPILVAGLLIPVEGMLLVEQPELHLHPKAQARLADFFLNLALTDRQCLIETHSDALVNQFRYQIVSFGEAAREKIAVYFVTQDPEGSANFAPIQISNSGNIINWPDDFFDETILLEDRITKASLRKRATQRND